MAEGNLIARVTNKAQSWLGDSYDAETRAEVQRMLDNEDKRELIDAFYKDLEFGTGGLRGIMGAGSNRMNRYTVGSASQGLANYLKSEFADLEQIKVVIGHDCRNNSREFAKITQMSSVQTTSRCTFRGPTPHPTRFIRYSQAGVPKRYYDYRFP